MGIVKPQRDICQDCAKVPRNALPRREQLLLRRRFRFCHHDPQQYRRMARQYFRSHEALQISEAFKDCLGPETRKYICAPCSNCKGQIRELLNTMILTPRTASAYGGLVELIVNAMSNKPARLHHGKATNKIGQNRRGANPAPFASLIKKMFFTEVKTSSDIPGCPCG